MPLLGKKRVLAVKQETVVGTAIALTNTDALWAMDAKIDLEIEFNQRPNDATLGQRSGVIGGKKGKANFKLEVKGSGAAGTSAAWALALLPACGMKETSGTWAPSSTVSDQKTVTIGLYEDGVVKSICGAVGTVNFEGEAGKPMTASFEFEGIWVDPTDQALLTPEADTIKPPAFKGATLTYASVAAPVSKFSVQLGNKHQVREDITAATGYCYAVITEREVTGKLDPEATLTATHNVFADLVNATEQTLSCAVGSTAGNIVTFAGPKVQLKSVGEGNRNDLITNELDMQFNISTGNDELTIAFG